MGHKQHIPVNMQIVQLTLLLVFVCVEVWCMKCNCGDQRCKLTSVDKQWKWTKNACENQDKACATPGVCYVKSGTEVKLITASRTTDPTDEPTVKGDEPTGTTVKKDEPTVKGDEPTGTTVKKDEPTVKGDEPTEATVKEDEPTQAPEAPTEA